MKFRTDYLNRYSNRSLIISIIFQHPVALVKDLIRRGGGGGGAALKVQLLLVLVDCWCATLSLFYKCYIYDMFWPYKDIIR
jgi:hypothetical protein